MVCVLFQKGSSALDGVSRGRKMLSVGYQFAARVYRNKSAIGLFFHYVHVKAFQLNIAGIAQWSSWKAVCILEWGSRNIFENCAPYGHNCKLFSLFTLSAPSSGWPCKFPWGGNVIGWFACLTFVSQRKWKWCRFGSCRWSLCQSAVSLALWNGPLQIILKGIFKVAGGSVSIRDWATEGMRRVDGKTKIAACWFKLYHPDGCPLSNELCSFAH